MKNKLGILAALALSLAVTGSTLASAKPSVKKNSAAVQTKKKSKTKKHHKTSKATKATKTMKKDAGTTTPSSK